MLLLVATTSCSGSCSRDDRKETDAESASGRATGRPEAEFEGAYPAEALATDAVREFALRAAPATLPLLEGRPLRVWAYNGQVPGPTLRVRRNMKVRVTFRNDLPEPSTVHWHGVRVPNAMDGVPHVTQAPVPPGGSFVYEFVPKDAGTFWFHPHIRSSEQVERGLFGVLIVEDDEPRPYSRELVWVLDDWRLDERGQIDERFNTRHDLAHDGRWGDLITVNGEKEPTIPLRAGERIRLRIVNVANGRVFRLDFGALGARGIAVDGLLARAPFELESFDLAPGNRLDVDFVVPRASSPIRVLDRYTRSENLIATLPTLPVDDGQDVQIPVFDSPARGRVPTWSEATAIPVAAELVLDAQSGGPYGIAWTINGVALSHDRHDRFKPIFTLKRGAFARLSFANRSARIHPMHLHGTFFKVLARNGAPVDEPFFRDTVLVRPKERVDVGLVPLDEGTWMMHCHILEHAESGMMTLFRVAGGH